MSKQMSLIVRNATKQDIESYAGRPSAQTIRAVVGELDGRIIGIGGMYLQSGRWYAFADIPEEARKYKVHIIRAAVRFLADARSSGVRFVYACRDEGEAGSLKWLTSLGFEIDPRSMIFFRWRA
jgi:hypothetical protein